MAVSQSSDKNAKTILKLLCQNQLAGGDPYSTVQSLMKTTIKAKSEYGIVTFLQKYPNLFDVHLDDLDSRWVVRPKTDVKICKTHTESAGSCYRPCQDLHVCKFYIMGKDGCKRPDAGKKSCHYLHDLYSGHNLYVLQSNLLDELDEDELRLILKQVDHHEPRQQNPITCKFYNTSGCQKGTSCPFLHLCSHYVTGDCKFKSGCKRIHNLSDPQPKAILRKFDMEPSSVLAEIAILERLRQSLTSAGVQTYRSSDHDAMSYSRLSQDPSGYKLGDYLGGARPKYQARPVFNFDGFQSTLFPSQFQLSPRSPSDTDQINDFCPYFLKGQCKFGDSCYNFHPSSHLPYQWQVTSPHSQGQEWSDVSVNVNSALETAYSNPANSRHSFRIDGNYQYTVDFDSMALLAGPSSSKIRRLSTRSSEETAPSGKLIVATEWKWYWKDQDDTWRLYGSMAENMGSCSTSSSDLEKQYLVSNDDKIEFVTDSYEYIMDFGQMQQRNKKVGTKRPVRRRPELVTRDSLPGKIKEAVQRARHRALTDNIIVPKTWTPTSPSADTFCKVQLDNSSSEFAEIEKFVLGSLDAVHKILGIKAIYRIQNLELFEQFESKKKWMMKKSSPSPGNSLERRLFHGTKQRYIDAICQQGFDWRVSGMSTGTKFGKGSYFSTSAAYSVNYTNSQELFVARVLTGDYAVGDKSYTRPPSKDRRNPASPLFDSCVDRTPDPTMFIIFDLAQAYPEYIVNLF